MFFKQRFWIGLSTLLLISIALAACSPAGLPAAATPTGGPPPAAASPTAAPTTAPPTETPGAPQAVLQEYTNPEFGFSLAYPDGFEAQSSFYHTVVFLAPQGTPGHRERAILNVELAGDLTAEWFARRMKEENDNYGSIISFSEMSIDGQPAYVLGRVPGQDLNRQVFVVNQGILYHLTFMPDHPNEFDANQQMETLYAAVMSSLRFLPERLEVPPVTSLSNMLYQIERAVETRSQDDVLRTLGDEFMVLTWLNPGVGHESIGRNEAAALILQNHLSPAPDLLIQEGQNWPSVAGSPTAFTGFFPDEYVTPVLVQGWGPQGSDEAVIIIARRNDGSLYWRGVLAAQGAFVQ